jgi:hypothetical protein
LYEVYKIYKMMVAGGERERDRKLLFKEYGILVWKDKTLELGGGHGCIAI